MGSSLTKDRLKLQLPKAAAKGRDGKTTDFDIKKAAIKNYAAAMEDHNKSIKDLEVMYSNCISALEAMTASYEHMLVDCDSSQLTSGAQNFSRGITRLRDGAAYDDFAEKLRFSRSRHFHRIQKDYESLNVVRKERQAAEAEYRKYEKQCQKLESRKDDNTRNLLSYTKAVEHRDRSEVTFRRICADFDGEYENFRTHLREAVAEDMLQVALQLCTMFDASTQEMRRCHEDLVTTAASERNERAARQDPSAQRTASSANAPPYTYSVMETPYSCYGSALAVPSMQSIAQPNAPPEEPQKLSEVPQKPRNPFTQSQALPEALPAPPPEKPRATATDG